MGNQFGKIITLSLFILSSSASYSEESIQGKNWQLSVKNKESPFVTSIVHFLNLSDVHYADFFNSIGLERVKTRPLKIRIFPNFEQFKKYQKENSKSRSNSAFYSLFNLEIVTWEQESIDKMLRYIFHEASHHYIRQFLPRENLPRCLDEGIAEVLEQSTLENHRINTVGKNIYWQDLVKKAFSQKKQLPFSFFLKLDTPKFVRYQNSDFPKINIAQCWAQSYFLFNFNGGEFKPVLRDLLLSSSSPQSVEEIIEESIPGDGTLELVQRQWMTFLTSM